MRKDRASYKKIDAHLYGKLLYQMDIQAFNRSFDYPSPSVQMTLDYLKNCEVYLVYLGQKVIGTFSFDASKSEVEIKQIIVLPDYQNKGYGTKIISKILHLNKLRNLWLITHPLNTSAVILYLKNEFEITGWKDNYYGDGKPRIILKHYYNRID